MRQVRPTEALFEILQTLEDYRHRTHARIEGNILVEKEKLDNARTQVYIYIIFVEKEIFVACLLSVKINIRCVSS